jgi:hypothetical protein
MVGGDFLLMPPFGLSGAALASLASNIAGLAVCVTGFERLAHVPAGQLVPRVSDFSAFVRDCIEMVRSITRSAPSAINPPDA